MNKEEKGNKNAIIETPPKPTENFVLKRKRVAELVKQSNGTIAISKAMRLAGYSKSSANCGKDIKRVRESSQVQKAIKENEKKIEKIIQASYKRALETAHKATYRDAITGIDTLTKTKRLIQGKTTENVGVNIASVLNQLENGDI